MAICFRDKTFCSSDCINVECFRHFGLDDQAAADKWWEGIEGEPPIAFSDFSSDCSDYKPGGKDG